MWVRDESERACGSCVHWALRSVATGNPSVGENRNLYFLLCAAFGMRSWGRCSPSCLKKSTPLPLLTGTVNWLPSHSFMSRQKELLPCIVRDEHLITEVTNTPGSLDMDTDWFHPVAERGKLGVWPVPKSCFIFCVTNCLAWTGGRPERLPLSPFHCCGCSADRVTPRTDDKLRGLQLNDSGRETELQLKQPCSRSSLWPCQPLQIWPANLKQQSPCAYPSSEPALGLLSSAFIS